MRKIINGKPSRQYMRDYYRIWRIDNRDQYNQYMNQYTKQRNGKLRQLLLCFLSENEPKCETCGFSDIRALQIDHINGGGAKERREQMGNKCNMYSYYLNHPEEARQKLQVLCANCNWIKRYENHEAKGNHIL